MVWQFGLWGLFGGFAVEALEFLRAIRRVGNWPWFSKDGGEPGAGPMLASVLVRMGIGYGLAAAATASGQVSGPLGAIAIGVAAPLVIEQLGAQSPPGLSQSR
jgi:hypothetical protein